MWILKGEHMKKYKLNFKTIEMKKIFCLITMIAVIIFTACEKEDLINHNTKEHVGIPCFQSIDEFNEVLAKIPAMSKPERLKWEKSKDFKSFGTISDEFYESVDPYRFKTMKEVKEFVSLNNDKIDLFTLSDGEMYCTSKDYENPKRYLINENREYIIGTQVFKDEEKMSEKTNNNYILNSPLKAPSAFTQSDEIIATSKIGRDNYKMHIKIKTYNLFDGLMTNVHKELKLTNYARWLAIWWERTYTTEYRITLKTKDYAYGVTTDGNGDNTMTQGIKSQYIIGYMLPVVAGPGNSSPELVYYNVYAKNEKNCVVNKSKTY